MGDKGAADVAVILVDKIIIEGHNEVLVPVSCAVHPETDYIFNTQEDVLQKYNLLICDTCTNGKQKLIMRYVLNQNKERLIVPANTPIGLLTALDGCIAEVTIITENGTTVSFRFDDVIDKEELCKVQRCILIQLLQQDSDVFGEKITRMEKTDLVQHYIDVEDTRPIYQKPYRLTASEKEALNQEVTEMLLGDTIEESVSLWSSPIILVPKEDGLNRL